MQTSLFDLPDNNRENHSEEVEENVAKREEEIQQLLNNLS